MPLSNTDYPSAEELIPEAVAALRARNRERATELLLRALQLNPADDQAWVWLAGVLRNDHERLYCLERALAYNPENTLAQKGYAAISPGTEARMPAVLEQLMPPPSEPPPETTPEPIEPIEHTEPAPEPIPDTSDPLSQEESPAESLPETQPQALFPPDELLPAELRATTEAETQPPGFTSTPAVPELSPEPPDFEFPNLELPTPTPPPTPTPAPRPEIVEQPSGPTEPPQHIEQVEHVDPNTLPAVIVLRELLATQSTPTAAHSPPTSPSASESNTSDQVANAEVAAVTPPELTVPSAATPTPETAPVTPTATSGQSPAITNPLPLIPETEEAPQDPIPPPQTASFLQPPAEPDLHKPAVVVSSDTSVPEQPWWKFWQRSSGSTVDTVDHTDTREKTLTTEQPAPPAPALAGADTAEDIDTAQDTQVKDLWKDQLVDPPQELNDLREQINAKNDSVPLWLWIVLGVAVLLTLIIIVTVVVVISG